MKLSSLNLIETIAPISLRQLLRRQAKRIFGIFVFLLAIYLTMSLFSWHPNDPSLSNNSTGIIQNLLGTLGAIISDLMLQILGISSFALISILILISADLILQNRKIYGLPRYIKYPFSFILITLMLSSIDITNSGLFKNIINWPYLVGGGGLFGDLLVQFTQGLINIYLDIIPVNHQKKFIFFFSSILLAVIYLLNRILLRYRKRKDTKLLQSDNMYQNIVKQRWNPFQFLLIFISKIIRNLIENVRGLLSRDDKQDLSFEEIRDSVHEKEIIDNIIVGESINADSTKNNFEIRPKIRRKKVVQREQDKANLDLFEKDKYSLPSVSLLRENNEVNYENKISQDELDQKAIELKEILLKYKVSGDIVNIRPGPVVSLFELQPSIGTKSQRVISLADDIAMSMKAVSARVAVIPGRNLIGIELPLEDRSTVYLSEIIKSDEFENSNHKLAIALGKNIGGNPVVVDLANMPHLLIAGTTGSGKSVGINTMILSLLYKYSPEDCKMIMIDPKMLELSIYEGIPHLLTPVVTEPKKAIVALKWILKEMEKRYKNMSKIGVRNLDGYNKKVEKEGGVFKHKVQVGYDDITGQPNYHNEEILLKKMPFIVVVVDEMADLMAVAGKEIEVSVARLAAMARAAGIHIIMATQRPSADVITGVIRANFPTRISFQVSSKIDSRVILNESGAEQLLGKGDMLHMSDGARINRIHGAFVDENEVASIVNFLKSQGAPEYLEEITKDPEEETNNNTNIGDANIDPQLYENAVRLILSDQKVSTSYIQRRLRIGYNRAADIIDKMESDGIISEADHAGSREILLNEQNFDNI